ncbi:MAG: hypothetical protein KA229_04070 [Chitinophagaceae bacterium]|nr:hypothetical protein [Chitinophagaceae bacterium]
MKRADFLKTGTLVALAPLCQPLFSMNKVVIVDEALLQRMISLNDKQVGSLLETVQEGKLSFSRKTAYEFSVLSASYCQKGSAYFQDARVLAKMEILARFLTFSQVEDGTVNIGNLESPPDTAFIVEIVCTATSNLQKQSLAVLQPLLGQLKNLLLKAGEALRTGGIHTPNHRWVICAALSQLNHLYPDKKYVARINEWLGEGIFQDADGHYPERSGTYSMVENTAFITMARLLSKTELLPYVRKNLRMYYYYQEASGDLVSNDSRRQDQYLARHSAILYLQYRYLAILDQDRQLAAICKMIEATPWFEKEVLEQGLFYFQENETLQQELPSATLLPERYEKLFATSHLLRIKNQQTSITLFGGIDWPLIIASGRSCSPDFFSYRKGKAILKYLRLSTTFFSMGYFYSEGLQKQGNRYVLHKKLQIPYYQPLPLSKRKKSGDYTLSPSIDNRFWNKMDFSNRPTSNIKTLDTTIYLTEKDGQVELEFIISGQQKVPVTIELCFNEGGSFSGLTTDAKGNQCLAGPSAVYTMEGDQISFGPGVLAGAVPENLEGERYSTHFGSLKTKGTQVFLTGVTPFKHQLRFH